MTRLLPLIAALSVLPMAAAAADQRPLLLPTHDVTVTYRITSSVRGAPSQVKMAIRAGAQNIRIEPDNAPGFLLVDHAAGHATMVLPSAHMTMQLPIDGGLDRYLNDPAAQFRRLGEGSVAGRPCTRWAMHAPSADGEGCVTADGIILRATGHDRHDKSGTAEAIEVVDGPIPPDRFVVPSDASKLDLSNLAKSLKLAQ